MYFVNLQQCYKPNGSHAVHLPSSISLSSLSLFPSPLFTHVQPFRSPSSITSLTPPSFAIYKRSVSIRLYHFHHGEFPLPPFLCSFRWESPFCSKEGGCLLGGVNGDRGEMCACTAKCGLTLQLQRSRETQQNANTRINTQTSF